MDWKSVLKVKVGSPFMVELEREVDADALAFLNKAELQKAFDDESIDITALEKIWTDEARAAAVEAKNNAARGANAPSHEEGSHYVTTGQRSGQLDFAGYINTKIGMAEGKARAYEAKAATAKGVEQRQFAHISNSYRATAGKLAVTRDTWNVKAP